MSDVDDRREHLRFDPEQNALVIIHIDGDEDNSLVGLLRDESYEGCGAVFHSEYFPYEEGDEVELKAHELSPLNARVSWIKPLDDKLIKAGFEFLE